ncbi:glycosyltransferase family 39 protein [Synechococcus sp. Nb3U1]|uniref:glycosyltransferase family 39 protein n=1 Tax=Synechococcus sp. Nb3U1 TaxID=1914529 RepID=UPI001F20D0E9|nr:glycosyltransferase family 39 protein [Synechococcus sp. Nb3U1]MCF2970887.1 glycosyltransferase family 39 protein [Synechococcus sp. Nb3U1]
MTVLDTVISSRRPSVLGMGLGIGLALTLWYGVFGYHVLQIGLWLLALLLVGLYLAQFPPAQPIWDPAKMNWRRELLHLGLLALVFIPIYLYDSANIPFQVNTDEIVITSMSRNASGVRFPDVFGLMPDYFYFPRFMFSLFGGLTRLMGGVTLTHMRMVHANFGVITILVAYGFFRAFWGSRLALAGAALLGSNHALLGISRMAMRENLIVLVECAALGLILKGVREKNPLLLYLGGAAAGFSLYGYLPGRVVILLGLLFGGMYLLLGREDLKGGDPQENPFWALTKLTVPAALGFFLMAAPILVATATSPSVSAEYSRQQFLFSPEGQALQQMWVNAATPGEAVRRNILNGLSMFNDRSQHDRGYIYPNYGHAFVDPLTGVLIWLGLGSGLYRIFKRRSQPQDWLCLSSFLFLYLLFSFVITKAPNYTRLLVILPFVAYLTLEGIQVILRALGGALERSGSRARGWLPGALGLGLVLLIGGVNLAIFGDFVQKGWKSGNDVASTGRYVEARKTDPNHHFYLAASPSYPYFSWGEPYFWQSWIQFFAGREQSATVFPPEELSTQTLEPPFTLFMNQWVWDQQGSDLQQRFPSGRLERIPAERGLWAFEVRDPQRKLYPRVH